MLFHHDSKYGLTSAQFAQQLGRLSSEAGRMRWIGVLCGTLVLSGGCNRAGGGMPPAAGSRDPTFVLENVKWTLDRSDAGFTYSGKGDIVSSDTVSVYLVTYMVPHTKRLNRMVPVDADPGARLSRQARGWINEQGD